MWCDIIDKNSYVWLLKLKLLKNLFVTWSLCELTVKFRILNVYIQYWEVCQIGSDFKPNLYWFFISSDFKPNNLIAQIIHPIIMLMIFIYNNKAVFCTFKDLTYDLKCSFLICFYFLFHLPHITLFSTTVHYCFFLQCWQLWHLFCIWLDGTWLLNISLIVYLYLFSFGIDVNMNSYKYYYYYYCVIMYHFNVKICTVVFYFFFTKWGNIIKNQLTVGYTITIILNKNV